jgi:hypothetical protein
MAALKRKAKVIKVKVQAPEPKQDKFWVLGLVVLLVAIAVLAVYCGYGAGYGG